MNFLDPIWMRSKHKFYYAGSIGRAVDSNVATLPFRQNGRGQSRTHLFVAASLSFGKSTIPVRLRNMSTSGALIEFAGAGPMKNDRILLRRDILEVAGSVAWIDGLRAGLAFDKTVEVTQWMARVGSVGQSRVDEIVAGIRSNSSSRTQASLPAKSDDLARQLQEVHDQLARLSEGLLEDDDVAMKHPQIQVFDIMLQKLDRLIKENIA
jgi:hypothetical protein